MKTGFESFHFILIYTSPLTGNILANKVKRRKERKIFIAIANKECKSKKWRKGSATKVGKKIIKRINKEKTNEKNIFDLKIIKCDIPPMKVRKCICRNVAIYASNCKVLDPC